jgi:branched-chain amino acid transport system substrate-binding protein
VALVALFTTGCGTRISHRQVMADAGLTGGSTAAGSPGADVGVGAGDVGTAQAGPTDTAAAGTSSGSSAGVAGQLGASLAPSGPTSSLAPATGPKSPIVIGNVSTIAGVAGAVQAPAVAAIKAWVSQVNARGGIGGHLIQLIAQDDGNDPSRDEAEVKDLVENQHVLAFVGNQAALSLSAATISYLEQKQVPVVGSDVTRPDEFQSSMYFPQSTLDANHLVWGTLVDAKRLSGKTKFGAFVCRESPGCSGQAQEMFNQGWAKAAGLSPAYRADVSSAQPDFTAECLGARNAGVEILDVVADDATLVRAERSCARQGYHPFFTEGTQSGADHEAADMPGETMSLTEFVFPWIENDTPATAEYQKAQRDSGFLTGPSASVGWAAGKLFEKAAANIGEPPSRQNLLQALWAMKGETLGGLTKVAFNQGGKPTIGDCWFTVLLTGGKWTMPHGGQMTCQSSPDQQ